MHDSLTFYLKHESQIKQQYLIDLLMGYFCRSDVQLQHLRWEKSFPETRYRNNPYTLADPAKQRVASSTRTIRAGPFRSWPLLFCGKKMMIRPPDSNEHTVPESAEGFEPSTRHSRKPSSGEISFNVQEALDSNDTHHIFETVGLNPDLEPIPFDGTRPSRCISKPSALHREHFNTSDEALFKAKIDRACAAMIELAEDDDTSSLEQLIDERSATAREASFISHFNEHTEQRQVVSPCLISPEKNEAALSQAMENLQTAMTKSSVTHEALQNWEKENGLPKNHSKTMRCSDYSRKQLQKSIMWIQMNRSPDHSQGILLSTRDSPMVIRRNPWRGWKR